MPTGSEGNVGEEGGRTLFEDFIASGHATSNAEKCSERRSANWTIDEYRKSRPGRFGGCDCRSYSGALTPNRAAASAYRGRSRGVPGAHIEGPAPHGRKWDHSGRARRIACPLGSRRPGPVG